MLLNLGSTTSQKREYYEQVFEVPFLFETTDYYEKLSQRFLEENSTSAYVKKVRQCFKVLFNNLDLRTLLIYLG